MPDGMSDIVDRATRSRMMANIKAKNTAPEIKVRHLLHQRGFRFRLHCKKLPGKPDIVLPKYHAVVQVQGCFWHGHKCSLFKWPGTRPEFWKSKIEKNILNDRKCLTALLGEGWRVATVWECAMRGTSRVSEETLINKLENWLRGSNSQLEIPIDE